MGRATFLTRVVLENYKSIARCDVRLGSLMYLVGPNGSGKSNFLDAIAFVAEALRTSVGGALRNRGGGRAICHAPNVAEGYFRIHLEFRDAEGESGHYTLRIGTLNDSRGITDWVVREEDFRLGPDGFRGDHVGGRTSFVRGLALQFNADAANVKSIYQALAGMRVYNIDPRKIEDVFSGPVETLLPDGSNLAGASFRLKSRSPDLFDRVNEYLRLILPSLIEAGPHNVTIEGSPKDMGNKTALIFRQRMASKTVQVFYPSQMSTGTLRTLGILTALLQPTESDQPSLIAIEEPEAHVHPAVLAVLRDAMNEASYRNQILAATQSADLLDHKEVSVDSVLVFEANEGVTSISGIAEIDRDVIRQRLYTPGELMRIGQLEPEPHVNGSDVRLAAAGESS